MSVIEPHREPHNKLQYIFDNARVGIAICNAVDNRLELVNPAFAHIHGYEPHELIGVSPGEVFAPECMLRLSEHESAPSACSMGDVSFETTHIRKDGSPVPVAVHITVIKNHKGEVVQRIANIIDISARKEAESKLKITTERYAQIFDNSIDPIYLIEVTPEGRFIHLEINPAFEHESGIPKEEIIGRYVDEFEDADFRDILLQKYGSCLDARKKVDFIAEYNLPGGKKTFHSTLSPIFDETGRLHKISGIARDITEQKKMESALETRKQEFLTLTTNSPDHIIRLDTQGRYLYLNPIHERTLGMPASEIIGKSKEELFPDHTAVLDAVDLIVETGVNEITVMQPVPGENGEMEIHEVKLLAEKNAVGEIVSILGIGRDITERLTQEKHLERTKAKLSAVISTIPDLIWVKDINGVYLMCNPAFANFFGTTENKIIGKTDYDFFEPDAADICKRSDLEAIAAGTVTLSYEPFVHPDSGAEGTWEIRKIPVSMPNGESMGILGIARDITERKLADQQLHQALEFNEEIMSTIPDLLFELDADGNYLNIWAQDETLLASQRSTLLGKNIKEVLPSDAAEIGLKTMRDVDRNGNSLGNTIYLDLPEGRKYFELSASKRKSSGTYIILSRDITARKEMEEKVSENENRLKAAQKIAKVGSWELDFSTVTLTWSDEIYRIFEVEPTFQPTYELFLNTIHPDDRDSVNAAFTDSLNNKTAYDIVHRLLMSDGRIKYVHERAENAYDEEGSPLRSVGTVQDITEQKSVEKKIEHMAHHDALTGLPNRTLAKARAEQLIASAKRSSTKAAILFIDLDGFKAINDTLGHSAGDAMLKTIASRLKECVRESDIISRQGGDEFLLILSDIKETEVIASIAKKVLAELEKSFEISNNTLSISGSIGIALYPDHGETFDALLQCADTAMYKAKELGKNSYHFYTQQMAHNIIGQFKIQNDLKSALINNQFVLFYQPQIDLLTNRIIGVEALIRWQHPQLGMIPPMNFIPVAETTGLIVPIGQWVIEEACRQAAVWHQNGIKITVAVNISAMQFKRGNLEEVVQNALASSQINPNWLELELTESIIMHDADNTLQSVRNLKALGVQLSLDDFGTGYSSLAYLKRFAVDKLKIDQSFVRDILQDRDDASIVKTIIQMAKNLNLKTIAEGVEDAQVLAVINAYGCDEVQGYHFAKPMEAHHFEDYHANFSVGKF